MTDPRLKTRSLGNRVDNVLGFARTNATGRAITVVATMYVVFALGTLRLCEGGFFKTIEGILTYVVGSTVVYLVAKGRHLEKREIFAVLIPASIITIAGFIVYALVALGWYALIALPLIGIVVFMATDPLVHSIVHGQPVPPTPSTATLRTPPPANDGYGPGGLRR